MRKMIHKFKDIIMPSKVLSNYSKYLRQCDIGINILAHSFDSLMVKRPNGEFMCKAIAYRAYYLKANSPVSIDNAHKVNEVYLGLECRQRAGTKEECVRHFCIVSEMVTYDV